MSPRPAVFLDRDGTLIEERNYPAQVQDIVPVDGAGQALRRLASAGYLSIVLTNQSAVARGMLTEEQLGALHEHLAAELSSSGRCFDALYYCPHHPRGTAAGYGFACRCRKPARGLLDLALADHDIDLARSAFIGDSPRDLFEDVTPSGHRILVATGHPIEDTTCADHVAASLPEAVDWLLAHEAREPPAAAAAD